ncbi:Hypothetical protein NCS54_00889100 [Fusarium falciforme]|uniref:Hypothetical protein n=1 Tax=Fusarium falciforme TaxID=195108 RepID=UPI0023006868|nr:Hypothetical protein NCS54_00889100 [Fusarium falciforme]WAO91421.1 Hypothetical protein NCS54_00889100 [Fusarium falciforme]
MLTVGQTSFILFEVPSNLLLKQFSPHVWQSRIFFMWGIITACQADSQNRHQLYAMRFLLGMFEAGMFPGVMAQLSSWYRTDEMGKPVTWLYTLVNLSGIVGALRCYGISYMNGLQGLSAWRWVNILEGVATVLFAGIVFWRLPDYPKSPRSGRFLSEREQELVEARLPENAPVTSDPNFSGKEIVATLRGPLIWAFLVSQATINVGCYALIWYLPTIITSMGFTGLPEDQPLNIPPSAAAILSAPAAAWLIGRAYFVRPAGALTDSKNWVLLGGMVACLIVFFTISNRIGIYMACILSNAFFNGYYLIFWAWRSATLSGSTATAFTLAFQSGLAQIGVIVGPQLFPSKWAYNRYKNSFAIAGAFTIVSFLANLWTWWLTRNTEYDAGAFQWRQGGRVHKE